MIRKPVLELFHQGAHMQRWNDHIRPKGFTELDKQSHKMIIAYVLAKIEEHENKAVLNWRGLVEGGLFEYLHRVILTDIKPPILYQLMEEQGEELNRWVLENLQEYLADVKEGFFEKCREYFFNPRFWEYEKKILRASHFLATNWEFKIIYNLNSHVFGIEETKKRIEDELEQHYTLEGFRQLQQDRKTCDFLDLVGQLRFQLRWSQSPRIPETSVMGHMLAVAVLAYLCSLEMKAVDKRICNNFFAALFHDLPEVLTRDIISPVKRSVSGLDKLIKEIENRQLDEKIFPLLPAYFHKEIKYFIREEFDSKIIEEGVIKNVASDEINSSYNDEKYNPVDGEVLKACDQLAAYIEAALSMTHGITSNHLREGYNSLYRANKNKKVAGVDFGLLYDYYKI